MQADQIIAKSGSFVDDFVEAIMNDTLEPAKKQAYFLDNQDELRKYMNALKTVISSIEGIDPDDETLDEESQDLLNSAKEIQKKASDAIKNFQEQMKIDEDVEDTAAVLNESTLVENLKKNRTSQEIAENLKNIEKEKRTAVGFKYQYALVCDDDINLLETSTKSELVAAINNIANQRQYKNISLYKLSATLVPLKTQVSLTI